MVLNLGDRVIELTNPGSSSSRYAATIDGKPVPIRYRFQSRHACTYDPKPFLWDWMQEDTASIIHLHHVMWTVPERVDDSLVFRFAETEGASTAYLGSIEITIREDVLVIDVMLEGQQLRLDLGGPILEFVRVEDGNNARFAAEVDGTRVPIQMHRGHTDINDHTEETAEAGLTAVLWELDEIYGAPEREGDAFVFEVNSETYDERRKIGRVTIAYRDGIVHWNAELHDT
jgi:hypothetical protein